MTESGRELLRRCKRAGKFKQQGKRSNRWTLRPAAAASLEAGHLQLMRQLPLLKNHQWCWPAWRLMQGMLVADDNKHNIAFARPTPFLGAPARTLKHNRRSHTVARLRWANFVITASGRHTMAPADVQWRASFPFRRRQQSTRTSRRRRLVRLIKLKLVFKGKHSAPSSGRRWGSLFFLAASRKRNKCATKLILSASYTTAGCYLFPRAAADPIPL